MNPPSEEVIVPALAGHCDDAYHTGVGLVFDRKPFMGDAVLLAVIQNGRRFNLVEEVPAEES